MGTGMFGREGRTLKNKLCCIDQESKKTQIVTIRNEWEVGGMAVHSYNPNTYVAEAGRFAQMLGVNLDNM